MQRFVGDSASAAIFGREPGCWCCQNARALDFVELLQMIAGEAAPGLSTKDCGRSSLSQNWLLLPQSFGAAPKSQKLWHLDRILQSIPICKCYPHYPNSIHIFIHILLSYPYQFSYNSPSPKYNQFTSIHKYIINYLKRLCTFLSLFCFN